jgi:hypothetical protein
LQALELAADRTGGDTAGDEVASSSFSVSAIACMFQIAMFDGDRLFSS